MADFLHIDIETYSSISLKKSGAYRYFEAVDFDIILVAWALNDGPVQIADLLSGDTLHHSFLEALQDPAVVKYAHNAAFERNAFRAFGYDVPTEQWQCTMIKAAYCGLPLSLANVGKVLGFGANKAKKAEGRALIKFFCEPCRPTKKNGKRKRNLPEHDPEKWAQFKDYCMRDVVAERAIHDRLTDYEWPAFERENYLLDQEINDRGIALDLTLAEAAAKIDEERTNELKNRLRELTGVDNPNSSAQLKEWLSRAMQKPIKSLAKDKIAGLLEEAGSGAVSEVLKLRRKTAKTSTKKYLAMMECAGEGTRARGLLQFYGANRTGRWAGRLIQVQNLPRNYIPDLALAREITRSGDGDLVGFLWGSVPGILSQLIRTAFVAKEGHLLAVADFSAIEARVTAWLAEEEWRLDVFHSHGKIYEASASRMFGVPIEEVTKGSDLRQRGKVAELALGYGGSVGALTNMGGADMGLSADEMRIIVDRWRLANPSIVAFWKTVERAAKIAVKARRREETGIPGLSYYYDGQALQAELPSGRALFYWKPSFGTNRFGGESLCYEGMNQTTKKWERIETYGGKLTENLVQAIARDLLAEAMLKIDRENFDIVMHVHDEAVCEVPENEAPQTLAKMCALMGEAIPWAEGLPLGADGYITPFYKKD